MQNLKKKLAAKLKKAKKTALLCIGSELRSDDAAGILVAKHLLEKKITAKKQFKVFIGETAPENLTGEIKTFNPDLLVIIDAANLGKKPGTTAVFSAKQLRGVSFSTHTLPLGMIIDYIKGYVDCSVVLIGIQPKSIEFGISVTPAVKKAAKALAALISELLHV